MKRLCVVLAALLGACGGAPQDDAAGPPAAPAAAASDAFVARTRALAASASDDGEPINVDAAAAPNHTEAPDNTEALALDE